MSVVVLGLEHSHAPLDLLERVAVGDADVPKVLATLRDRPNLQESVLLSTCLRTEVYAVVDRFHEAVSEVQELLAERAGIPTETLSAYARMWVDDDVLGHLGAAAGAMPAYGTIQVEDDVPAHLFAVASGLRSAVLGESEVLGQVRRAWERARDELVSGPVLGELFRHAVHTGKRVRAETAIGRGATSFAHAAVELAESRMARGLHDAEVVVAGAGEMGSGMVSALVALPEARRPTTVTVANRSEARARELARQAPPGVEVRPVELGQLRSAAARADLVVTTLDTDRHVLGAHELALGQEPGRTVVVLDLGVPRNVDPRLGGHKGVVLLDMEDLRSSVTRALEERRAETDQAEAIVTEEVARYREATRARGAAPVVAALRAKLEEARSQELARRRTQFGVLSDEDWLEVDAVTRAVLAKLLHDPTTLLKETAGTPRGERLVEALRLLFDL